MKKIVILIILVTRGCLLFSQAQLTNNGDMKFHDGSTVTFFGNFSNNGALSDEGQMITFKGSSAQTIGGSSTSTFKNITLDNAAGLSLSTNENLKGILTISDGTFTTTGHSFTLLSDADGTASIGPIRGNFAGNITMQRYIGTGPTDWRFIASPVSNGTFFDWGQDFAVSGIPHSQFANFNFVSLYGYNEAATGGAGSGYVAPTDMYNVIPAGAGYWAYIGPTPLTIDITGTPNKFNQSLPVTFTSNGGSNEDGWNMAGNPYPSAIDWTSNAWTKSHMNNAIYIWNPELQQYSSYVAGVGVNGGSNIIASSQAFWVQANGANPVLTATEDVKVSTDQSFIRHTNTTNSFDFLKLTLTGNGYSDETFIRFDAAATDTFDTELDARKIFSSSQDVPSLSTADQTNTDMSINSIPPVNAGISIPVKTLVGLSGSYTITRDSSSSILPDYCIVLEDLLTGTRINLMQTPSYTFSIADTTQAARFILHVGSSAIHVQTTAASCNGMTNGVAIAQSDDNGTKTYIWTNAGNDTIHSTLQAGSTDTLSNMAAGEYFVTVIDASGMCSNSTASFMIDQPNVVEADFSLSADTLVMGISDSLYLTNTSTDASAFVWSYGDGSIADTAGTPAPHVFSQAGTYTISLVASHNACSDSVAKTVVVVNAPAVGIEQHGTSGAVTLFPNPSQGQFNIAMPQGISGALSLEVYTLLGARIYAAPLNEGNSNVDMSMHAKGIYSYRIFADNKPVYTGQLILE